MKLFSGAPQDLPRLAASVLAVTLKPSQSLIPTMMDPLEIVMWEGLGWLGPVTRISAFQYGYFHHIRYRNEESSREF